MNKKNILMFIIVFAAGIYNASSAGVYAVAVTGIVADSATKRPLSNVSVQLIKMPEQDITERGTTDSDGRFTVSIKSAGLYRIELAHIGYRKKIPGTVQVKEGEAPLDLGIYYMKETGYQMQAVDIIAEKKGVVYENGRVIVNVAKLKESDNETLLDILKKVPLITINSSGKVCINGNSNIAVLQNGKPSNITDESMLAQQSIYNIDRIEVSVTPSAKYDAEGGAGIIDIRYKADDTYEIKSRINGSLGTLDNYSGGADASYVKKGVQLFGSYSGRYSHNDSRYEYTRISPASIIPGLNRNSESYYKTDSHLFKLGLDYPLSGKNILSSAITYTRGGNLNNSETSSFQQSINAGGVSHSYLKNYKNGNGYAFDYLLSYTDRQSETREFDINFYYSASENISTTDRNDTYYALNYVKKEIDYFESSNKFYSLFMDYTKKFSDDWKMEAGLKGVYRDRMAEYRQEEAAGTGSFNCGPESDIFRMNDHIYSLYLLYSGKTGALSFSAGLRGEYTYYTADQKTLNVKTSNKYFDIFPSVSLTYSFARDNSINLSYSRRLERPYLFQLNPFTRKITGDSYESGNPKLRPVYYDRVQLSKDMSPYSIPANMSLYYEYIGNIINHPTELRSDGTTYSTPRNNERVKKIGASVNVNTPVFSWWNTRLGLIYSASYGEAERFNYEVIKYRTDMKILTVNNAIDLGYDIKAGLSFIIIPGYRTAESKAYDSFSSDLTLNKTFFERSLSLSLRVLNMITSVSKSDYHGKDYNSFSRYEPRNRIISLSISYNFNKFRSQNNEKPEEDTGANEY